MWVYGIGINGKDIGLGFTLERCGICILVAHYLSNY